MNAPRLVRSLVEPPTPAGAEGATIQRNVSWLIVDRTLRLALNLIVNVWIIRYLGPAQLGLLSFVQSLVGMVGVLSVLGIDVILVRDLVRRPADADRILGTAFGLRLVGAATTLALTQLAVHALRPGDPAASALTLVFGGALAFQALDVIESWFQSRSHVAPYVLARSAAFLLGSMAKVAAVLARAPLEWLAVAIVSEFVLGAAAIAIAYRRQPHAPPRWRFEAKRARDLLAESWPLVINSAAVLVSMRLDQTLITILRGAHENGIYAAAQRLTDILFFVPVAFTTASAPALIRSHAEDPQVYARRLGKLFRLLGWIALAIAIPTSLLSPWVVPWLFGRGFEATAPTLAIHVWGTPALFLGVAQSNWFVTEGRLRELMARSLTGAALSVVLNLALIPSLGARGAALATVAAHTVAHVLLNAVPAHTRWLFRLQLRALLPGGLR